LREFLRMPSAFALLEQDTLNLVLLFWVV